MSSSEEKQLLKASEEGDIKSVQDLLAVNGISFNCEDILIKKTFMIFKIYLFYYIRIFHHFWNLI